MELEEVQQIPHRPGSSDRYEEGFVAPKGTVKRDETADGSGQQY